MGTVDELIVVPSGRTLLLDDPIFTVDGGLEIPIDGAVVLV